MGNRLGGSWHDWRTAILWSAFVSACSMTQADSWERFRGPNGTGVAPATATLPLTWSNETLVWKTPIARGSSCPIVVDNLIVLTGYSGYGEKLDDPGSRSDLQLHVLALSRDDGSQQWTLTVDPSPEEQEATPRIADHGYASPTPCTDGERIYAAFGPSGVICCSLEGKEIWRTSIGSGVAGFGAAASPIVHEDLVYINAAIESQSLVALDKHSGTVVWTVDDIKKAWTTPTLVHLDEGATELVMHHKDLIRGYDPKTGAVLWTCRGIPDYVVPGIVVVGETLYCSGGRQNRTIAVKAGGRGDVTDTHKLWEVNVGANVTTPLFHNGHLYWSHDKAMAQCLNADDGSTLYRERYESRDRVYASPVLGSGRIYAQLRNGTCLVIAAKPEFEVLAENELGDGGEDEQFNATPAIDGNRLYLRSTKAVYCVSE